MASKRACCRRGSSLATSARMQARSVDRMRGGQRRLVAPVAWHEPSSAGRREHVASRRQRRRGPDLLRTDETGRCAGHGTADLASDETRPSDPALSSEPLWAPPSAWEGEVGGAVRGGWHARGAGGSPNPDPARRFLLRVRPYLDPLHPLSRRHLAADGRHWGAPVAGSRVRGPSKARPPARPRARNSGCWDAAAQRATEGGNRRSAWSVSSPTPGRARHHRACARSPQVRVPGPQAGRLRHVRPWPYWSCRRRVIATVGTGPKTATAVAAAGLLGGGPGWADNDLAIDFTDSGGGWWWTAIPPDLRNCDLVARVFGVSAPSPTDA